ncbi:MAG: phospholipase A [Campylobacteraceae bacterium]|nr:phospholipase A [Campylobacteraceae bacterium]
MRLVFAVLFCTLSFLFADDAVRFQAQNAYENAKAYEQDNKSEEALLWYKKAAAIALGGANSSAQNLEAFLSDNDSFVLDNLTKYKDNYARFLSEYDDDDTKNSVVQILSSSFGILPYKMNFLLPVTYDFMEHDDDRNAVETVFQFSLRKDILKNFFGLDEIFGIAYTQRSWWQIAKHSTPFRETNYMPEIYVVLPFWNDSSFFKAYKFAFIHESNGQVDPASRSWNRLYFEGFFQVKGLFINPRIWYRIHESEIYDDNPDILDYIGYGDLTLTYPYKEHLFKVLLRNNLDWDDNRGALQADWTFPIFKSGLFGYVQYFGGYGESLVDYKHKTRRLSLGFAFSR